jgi:chemotaxis signal transduction protein
MLRRAVPRTPAAPRRTIVVVDVRGRRLAAPAERVVEVARTGRYTRVPCEDPSNLGVVMHRGAVVPLVDVGTRLGVPAAPSVPDLCLFLRTQLGEIGVPIDQVVGLEPAPDGGLPEGVTLLDGSVLGGSHGQSPAH